MNKSTISDWAIIGGGMMGMTLALRLAKSGQQVTIYEAAPEWGGLTSAWDLNDQVQWDRFYHVTLLTDNYLRELLHELGLEEKIRWVETKTGFFSGGRLHSMSNSLEFLRFPVLSLYQKFRLATTIMYGSRVKDWRRLEQIPLEQWLRKLSGNSTFEKIWLPLIKAKLGDNYQAVSAAFIWAYISRMYKARRTGMKREMFGYVPGGYARILESLTGELKALGVTLKTSHPVATVNRSQHDLRVEFVGQPTVNHQGVIFTIPSTQVSRVCPDLSHDEHQRLQEIEYLGVVCASVLLKKPLSKYYVTNITDDWVPLTGVIEMTTIVDPNELGDHSLVYLPLYVRATDDASFHESDDSIKTRLLATLEKMYPEFSRDDVAAFKVARARNVMSLPTLNYSTKLAPMETSIPGLYVINSSHIVRGNLNVNETIQVALEGFEVLQSKFPAQQHLANEAISEAKSGDNFQALETEMAESTR